MSIILASASPRRSEIMRLAGYSFRVIPTNAEEIIPEGLDARQTAEQLSIVKADAAMKSAGKDDTVICADTLVTADGIILGKPKDAAEAFRMLSFLSGRTHTVYTGVSVVKDGLVKTFSVKTDVVFYELSDQEISDYISTGEPFDKAGAYGIQGLGAVFVKEIHGDYFNVMGLPIAELTRVLRKW